jgi:transposase
VPDSKEFAAIYARLAQRCRALAGDVAGEVTLVFDKGNNSRENLALVAREQMHFVSSLVPGQHKDLLEVPLAAYREVHPTRWPGLLVYRTTKQVFGAERTVVVTFNPALWEGQLRGLNAQRAKLEAALRAVQSRLARWAQAPPPRGRRPTVARTEALLRRLLRAQQLGSFVRYTVTADDDGVVRLDYTWDEAALQAMIDRYFGKTLLFTDQHDWTDEAIVAAYRSQAKIEDAFKQMKDTHFVSWRPLFHWTDQKIRVHAAYCVFALLFAALLLREVRRAGFQVGLDSLLETLAGIKGVIDLPKHDGRARTQPVAIRLTRRPPDLERLFQILDLQRLHPETQPRPSGATS